MKKILLFAVILLIASMLVFAGGGKEKSGGIGAGVLATGEWNAYTDVNDKGSSTAVITSSEEEIGGEKVITHRIVGNVTTQFQYGFAGWGLDADEATIEKYKTAKAFSFWILGDGKAYTIKFKTSNIQDFGYFEYRFATEPGEAMYIEVPMGFFFQPSWAAPARKNQELVTGIEWQTHESWRKDPRNNPFEVKIWNFKVHN